MDQDDPVLYFPPKTIFLEEPEKQRQWRDQLISLMSQSLKPPKEVSFESKLRSNFVETLKDLSQPSSVRIYLANYFHDRRECLRVQKIKTLQRWAHFGSEAQEIEGVGQQLNKQLAHIIYQMHNSSERFERLQLDDDYDVAMVNDRPRPKAQIGGSLFMEHINREPFSNIRQDDFEVYFRSHCYDQTVQKPTRKLIHAVKWLPVSHKGRFMLEGYKQKKEFQKELFKISQNRFQRLRQIRNKESRGDDGIGAIKQDDDQFDSFAFEFNSKCEYLQKIQDGFYDNIDLEALKTIILEKSSHFGIEGDIELDSGHSFTYQVQIFFPTYFELQVIQSTFTIQGPDPTKEPQLFTFDRLRKMQIISDEMENQEEKINFFEKNKFKAIRLKKMPKLDYKIIRPQIELAQEEMEAILKQSQRDALLKSAFDFLDIQDLVQTNMVIEDLSRLPFPQDFDKAKPGDFNEVLQMFEKAFEAENKGISAARVYPTSDNRQSQNKTPQHMIQALFFLRHLNSRDMKIRILYFLNFFESVKKRIITDLASINGTSQEEYLLTKSQEMSIMINNKEEFQEQFQGSKLFAQNEDEKAENQSQKEEEDEINLKQYKVQNSIHGLSKTLPYPYTNKQQYLHNDFKQITSGLELYKLLDKSDFYEWDESRKMLYIRDDEGKNIFYDSTFKQYINLEEHLLRVGTKLIENNQGLADRLCLVEAMLTGEEKYIKAKVEMILTLIEVYEHLTDKHEMQRVGQQIFDLIAKRAVWETNETSFMKYYEAQTRVIEKKNVVLREIMDKQIEREIRINKRIIPKKEDIIDCIEALKAGYKAAERYSNNDNDVNLNTVDEANKTAELTQSHNTKDEDHKKIKSIRAEKIKKLIAGNKPLQSFGEVLGLPQVTVENLYKEYIEKEPVVIEAMADNGTFIKMQEGYPDLLVEPGLFNDKIICKLTQQAKEMGVLDFYRGYMQIPALLQVLDQGAQQIIDETQPECLELAAHIQIEYFKEVEKKFRDITFEQDKQAEGYVGQNLIESDLITANGDNVSFHIKLMHSMVNDTEAPPQDKDPYLMAKLHHDQILQFKFPIVKRADNVEGDGGGGGDSDVYESVQTENSEIRKAMENQSSIKGSIMQRVINHIKHLPAIEKAMKSLKFQPMLVSYCNAIELLRLRDNFERVKTELRSLEECYDFQKNLVNRPNIKLIFNDHIAFDNFLEEVSRLNFVDDGTASKHEMDLAIREFDPSLKSNMNFNNPKSLQYMTTNSGLEDMRAVVMYETFQTHLLSIACLTNDKLLFTHEKMLNELEYIKLGIMPKTHILNIHSIANMNSADGYSKEALDQERIKIKQELQTELAGVFVQVSSWKTSLRAFVSKKYAAFVKSLGSSYIKYEAQLKLLRTYRIKLLHGFCIDILRKAYEDSNRAEILDLAQQLRIRSRFFPSDESNIFSFQQNDFRENFHYMPNGPNYDLKNEGVREDFVDFRRQLTDPFLIPGSKKIMKFENEYEHQPQLKPIMELDKDIDKVKQEAFIKDYVSSENLKNLIAKPKLQQSLKVQTLSELRSYYTLLLRIFDMEYLSITITSDVSNIIDMQQSTAKGFPFWNRDSLTDTEIDENAQLTSKVLEKISKQKKKMVALQEDIENLSENLISFKEILQKLQGDFSKAKSFMKSFYHKNYLIIANSIDKTLEHFYLENLNSQKDNSQEIIQLIFDKNRYLRRHQHVINLSKSSQLHSIQNESQKAIMNIDIDNTQQSMKYEQLRSTDDEEHRINYGLIDSMLALAGQKGSYSDFNQISRLPSNLLLKKQRYFQLLSSDTRKYLITQYNGTGAFLIECSKAVGTAKQSNLEQVQHEYYQILNTMSQTMQLKEILFFLYNKGNYITSKQLYQSQNKKFKSELLWKVQSLKDDYDKKQQQKQGFRQGAVTPTLEGGFSAVDNYMTCKFEFQVIKSELERIIKRKSIEVMKVFYDTLAQSYELNSRKLRDTLHPMQRFASTCYPTCDKYSHLDLVSKVPAVQAFLSKLRNRCTEVETLTSGPAVVFTVKDFNDCLQTLCRSLIKYSEEQQKEKMEVFVYRDQLFQDLFRAKESFHQNLRFQNFELKENLDKLINTKLYERGSQLIYDLDRAKRQSRMYKDNVYKLERELRVEIYKEFEETVRKQVMRIDNLSNLFDDYKYNVASVVKAEVSKEILRADKVLKQVADDMKNMPNQNNQLSVAFSSNIRASVHFDKASRGSADKRNNSVSQDGRHDNIHQSFAQQNTTLGISDANQKLKLMEEKELAQNSEIEARDEVSILQRTIWKLRTFWRIKETLLHLRFQKQFDNIKKEMVSNQCLWERLSETEKREQVLKQELLFTQQSLTLCEKQIEKLKDDLKTSENERMRLNQFKQNKAKRLDELESKVRKFEIMENVDLNKLLEMLYKQTKTIETMKKSTQGAEYRLNAVEKKKNTQITRLKDKYLHEVESKKDAIDKLENMKQTLRALEDEGEEGVSLEQMWKSKQVDLFNNVRCKTLYEYCLDMENENKKIRTLASSLQSKLQDQMKQMETKYQNQIMQMTQAISQKTGNLPHNLQYKNVIENKVMSLKNSNVSNLDSKLSTFHATPINGSIDASLNKSIQEPSKDFSNMQVQRNNQQIRGGISNPFSNMTSQRVSHKQLDQSLRNKKIAHSVPHKSPARSAKDSFSENPTGQIIFPPVQTGMRVQMDKNLSAQVTNESHTATFGNSFSSKPGKSLIGGTASVRQSLIEQQLGKRSSHHKKLSQADASLRGAKF